MTFGPQGPLKRKQGNQGTITTNKQTNVSFGNRKKNLNNIFTVNSIKYNIIK